jgi:hypothetical protein
LGTTGAAATRCSRPPSRLGGYLHAAILVALFAAVAVVTMWVHWVWPGGRAVAEDGLAALCAAVLGVVGTVGVNELALRSTTHIVVGVALLVLSLAAGVVTLIAMPESSSAEIGVSYAAAEVGVATLLGHTTGRRQPAAPELTPIEGCRSMLCETTSPTVRQQQGGASPAPQGSSEAAQASPRLQMSAQIDGLVVAGRAFIVYIRSLPNLHHHGSASGRVARSGRGDLNPRLPALELHRALSFVVNR